IAACDSRRFVCDYCWSSRGTIARVAATRLIEGFLYGVAATDPLTFLAVPVMLGVVALLASYFPARRATKVDPLRTLRYE
ncbi:MAG TPA: hypothetical protein VIG25_06210, partial [Pyrinomonadaceae bacterium]